MNKILGVLGGMGPLATVDFLQKLIEETPATRDQDHVPVITYSVPQIPDRPAAIAGTGESPFPHMLRGMLTLKHAGAQTAVIACNTAHYWYEDLTRESGLPILHIADAACEGLAVTRVGLLATTGTLAAGFYQRRFAQRGLACLVCNNGEQHTLVNAAIEHVKRNELAAAHALATRAADALLARGAQAVVLGCTEIPLAIEHTASEAAPLCIDATRALARACVAWWRSSTLGAVR
jgi:aspartate racemase